MMKKLHDGNSSTLMQMKSECERCSGLCCTALFFSKTDGFPEDKISGKPCSHLQDNYQCDIHEQLQQRGMKGCIGYDCFGAGPKVTQDLFEGHTWREYLRTGRDKDIFDTFVVVFHLYQIRYFLAEALTIIPAKKMSDEILGLLKENEQLCNYPFYAILDIDIHKYKCKVNPVLKQICSLVLDENETVHRKTSGEFAGKNFSGRDMRGLDFSMKLLIAADFSGCALSGSIFLGADTRDCNFCNADLTDTVFLSQGQINAAVGNCNTKIPMHLDYPVTWKD